MGKEKLEYQVVIDNNQMLKAAKETAKAMRNMGFEDAVVSGFERSLTSLEKKIFELSGKMQNGIFSEAEAKSIEKQVSTLVTKLNGLFLGVKGINIGPSNFKVIEEVMKTIEGADKNFDAQIASKKAELSASKSQKQRAIALEEDVKEGDFVDNPKQFAQLLAKNADNKDEFNRIVAEQIKEAQNKALSESNKELKELLVVLKSEKGRLSDEQIKKLQSFGVEPQDGKRLGRRAAIPQINKILDPQDKENISLQDQQILDKYTKLTEDLAKAQTRVTGTTATLQKELNGLNSEKKEVFDKYYAKQQEELNRVVEEGEKASKQYTDDLQAEASAMTDTTAAASAKAAATERMTDTVKRVFGLSAAFALVSNTVRTAIRDISELDAEITAIAVVTDQTSEQLWSSFSNYNEMAQELGVTAKDAYATSKLYYQQGLETNEVMSLTTETIKMARIAGMDYAEATNAMTAALRGFKLEMSEAGMINDVFSALAAKAAVDTQELSQSITKTASIAHSAGMEISTTSALLTQMIETTREPAENLGTAMKTIVARFQELKENPAELTAEVDGEVVEFNKVEKALKSAGVQLRDTNGEFRDLDDVFLELSSKWSGLDRNTQRYIATISAGSRQQSRFIAMMDNYERTMELVDIAQNSAGQSSVQFAKTMDSIDAKVNQLKSSFQEFYTQFVDSDLFKGILDLLNGILTGLNKLPSGVALVMAVVGSIIVKNLALGFIKGFQTAKEEYQKVREELSKPIKTKVDIGAEAQNTAEKQKQTAEEQKQTVEEQKQTAETKKQTAEDKQQTAEEKKQTAENKKQSKVVPTTLKGGLKASAGSAISAGIISAVVTGFATEDVGTAIVSGLGGALVAALPTLLPVLGKAIAGLVTKILGTAVVGAIGAAAAPIAIAVAAVGAVAFVAWYTSAEQVAKRATKKAREEYEEAIKQLEKKQAELSDQKTETSNLNSAVDEYKELEKNLARNAEEQERFNELANEIAELNPDLVSSYDDLGNAILQSAEALNEAAKASKMAQFDLQKQTNVVMAGAAAKEIALKEAELFEEYVSLRSYDSAGQTDYFENADSFEELVALQKDYHEGLEETKHVIGSGQARLYAEESIEFYEENIKNNKELNDLYTKQLRTLKLIGSEYLRIALAEHELLNGEKIEMSQGIRDIIGVKIGKEAQNWESRAREDLGFKEDEKLDDDEKKDLNEKIDSYEDEYTGEMLALYEGLVKKNPELIEQFDNLENLSKAEIDQLVKDAKTATGNTDYMVGLRTQVALGSLSSETAEILGAANLLGEGGITNDMANVAKKQQEEIDAVLKVLSASEEEGLAALRLPVLRALQSQIGDMELSERGAETGLSLYKGNVKLDELVAGFNFAENTEAMNLLASADLSSRTGATDLIDSLVEAGIEAEGLEDAVHGVIEAYSEATSLGEDYNTDMFADVAKAEIEGWDGFLEKLESVKKAEAEILNDGALSSETVRQMYADGYGDMVRLNPDTGEFELSGTSASVIEAERDASISRLNDELANARAMGDAEAVEAIENQIKIIEKIYETSVEEISDAVQAERDAAAEAERKKIIEQEQWILEQLKEQGQAEIDTKKEKYEEMEKIESEYLDAVKDAIDEERRLRDREESKDELAEKQKRLALLSSDTSGRYSKEILELQEEIAEMQQDMADTAQDDLLDAWTKEADARAEANEKEIEELQKQYDLKYSMAENYVADIVALMADGAGLIDLLKNSEKYKSATETEREQMEITAGKLFDLPGYSKGGLVDFTGAAMVHGSKARPEAFLSAADTKNVAALRDTLRLSPATGGSVGGETHYQIDVHVDSIATDEDIDAAVRKVEGKIMAASYGKRAPRGKR